MLVPAEYHRKAFTAKHHIAGVKDGFVRSLCGQEWTEKDDCPETQEKPGCQRCYASWNKRTHYGEHHPALGLPERENGMLHAIAVRRLEGD